VNEVGIGRRRARALGAITRRDWQLMRSYPLQIVTQFGRALIAVAAIATSARLVRNAPEMQQYGGDYFPYVLIGLSILVLVTVSLNTFSRRILEEQNLGTLEVVLASPIGLGTFLIGSLVIPMARATLIVVGYFVVAYLVFDVQLPFDGLLVAIPVSLLTVLAFGAIGVLSASFVLLTKRGDPIAIIAAQAATFLGGAIFPIALLPAWLRWSAVFFPSYWSIEALRQAMLGDDGPAGAVVPSMVLAAFALGLVVTSTLVFQATMRLCRRLGTLGVH
jgi:ABC-2 type transport system permease protein